MSDSITIENSDGETFAEVIDVVGVSEIKKAFHKSIKEGSLHKWFKGSKSKDGKPGWVNVVTGGTCASDKPGEGTPKCVSSSKRASMSKAERLSAARRKKKADPGQQAKTGAAKPTYVSTDKPKKKMSEEMKRDEYGDPIGGPKISKKQMKKNLMKNEPDEQHNTRMGESMEITEADKKGKGSGTKDACYHKVKSRYSVWPSAYASGALVKCRKVGAANWGNSSKKEDYNWEVKEQAAPDKRKIQQNKQSFNKAVADTVKGGAIVGGALVAKKVSDDRKKQMMGEEGYDVARDMGRVRPSKDKKDATSYPPSAEMRKTQKVNKGPSALERVKKKYKGQIMDVKKEEVELDEKCWKGYEKKGMKTMFGKRYPNCVKKEEYSDWRDEIEYVDEGASKAITLGIKGAVAGGKAVAKKVSRKAVRAGIKVGGKQGGKAVKKAGKVAATETKKAAAETAGAVSAGVSKGLKKRKERTLDKIKRKSEQMVSGEKLNEIVDKTLEKISTSAINTAQKSGAAMSKELVKGGAKVAGIGAGAYLGTKLIGKGMDRVLPDKKKPQKQKTVKEDYSDWRNDLTEDDMKGMSVKSGHKRPTKSGAGMTQKGVEAYRRRNPGSKLKTAVTTKPSKLKKGSKAANRRKSYCARSAGQMKKFPKAAKDPNSRLRQARRRWNC